MLGEGGLLRSNCESANNSVHEGDSIHSPEQRMSSRPDQAQQKSVVWGRQVVYGQAMPLYSDK